MKKIALSAAAMMAVATSAHAVDPSIDYNLQATVGDYCGVASAAGSTLTDVDFGDLSTLATTATNSVDPQGSIAYVCNDPDGFTRTVTSANAGVLVRTGSSGGQGNEIPYTMTSSGGFGFTDQSLTSPVSNSFSGSNFLTGQNTNISFKVNGVLSAGTGPQGSDQIQVFAGDYTDTVTISVTAN
ncbi:hypothetical protein [uncultured Algimonas sp.]|uniref:hypothetical protein n=1 Tax=uncultured Algimonas sp. TaxID=1547920 RepID=UPI00261B764F|nr:hypothetical protein [uncultured Algimonas sp.]